ncbi:hypothetical protein ACIQXW_15280 [Lysinibacillus sp. NPDC097162]|uniref:hypothetical protein n=1 Tax=Lysinibacillus sp. NPDC097162 TaxID=3364140 RepID=UPI00382FC3E5
MLLTERLDEKRTYFFVKFMPKEFVDRFRKGFIHMKNLKAYVDMEKESREKGIGDKHEASLVISNTKLDFFDEETNELVFTLDTDKLSLSNNQDLMHPVFCSYIIDSDSLEIFEETEDEVRVKIRAREDELERILKDFGLTAVLIEAHSFLERFTVACKEQELVANASKVSYYDYSVNQKERMDIFLDKNSTKRVFVKSDYFKHQNEHRFVLLNKQIEEPMDLFIGDISDITHVLDTRKLFANTYIKFGKNTK